MATAVDVKPAAATAARAAAPAQPGGAMVEFSTAALGFGRVRRGDNPKVLEVVISDLGGGGAGQYMLPLPHLAHVVNLTAHDRMLCDEIARRQAVTPDTARRAMLSVAKTGIAGQQAARAARQALAEEQNERALATVYLLQTAFNEAVASGADAPRADPSEPPRNRIRSQLLAVSARTGLSADACYAVIGEWGGLLGAIGVPRMPAECSLRRLARQASELASQLRRWADDEPSDAAAYARAIAQEAERAGAQARTEIAIIDRYAGAPAETVTTWREKRDTLRALATRVGWTLNGWDLCVARWRSAAQGSRDDQLRAVTLLLAMLPQPPEVAATQEVARKDAAPAAPTQEAPPAEHREATLSEADIRDLAQVKTQLFNLADGEFHRLAALAEAAREAAAARDALEAMRPRLRVTRPPRRVNVERVFARPFEDLLYNGDATRKRPGRIARGAIFPCWKVIARFADATKLDAIMAEVDQIGIGCVDWAGLGPRVWELALAAAQTVIERAKNAGERAALVAELGGEAAFAELVDMAGMLAITRHTEGLRAILAPKPLSRLEDKHALAVAGALRLVRAEDPARLASLAYFVIGRVGDPIDLALLYGGSACQDPALRVLGVTAAELATDELGVLVERLDNAGAATAQIIAERAEQIAGQLAKLRDGMREGGVEGSLAEVERILERLRTAVSQSVLPGSEDMIATAIDGADAGDAAARETQREAAEQRARALGKCARFAGKIGLDGEVRKTIKAIERAAELVAIGLLTALERGNGAAADAEASAATLGHAVCILELVAGPDRADELRKRGFGLLDRLRAA